MLRKMLGFDHCIKLDMLSATTIPAVDWMTGSGDAWSTPAPRGGYNTSISLDGWLAFGLNSTWASGAGCYAQLNNIAPASAATKLTIGFRMRSYSTYASNGTQPLLWYAWPTTAQTGILFDSDLPTLLTVGAEGYVEIILDFVAKTREIWLDGVFIKSVAFNPAAAAQTALNAGTYYLQFVSTYWVGPVVARWYRDIYVVDDVAGDGMVGRLGPQRLFPVYLDDFNGPWVSDDGATDLKATLNASLPAAAQVVSPVSKAPLSVSLKTSVPDGYKVTALDLRMSGQSKGDLTTNTKVEVIQGGTTLKTSVVTTPKTLTYGQSIGQLYLAADGGLFDAAKIDQTSIVFTPDQ